MSYFKGKMHEVRFRLGPTSKEREARKGGVEGQGRRERKEEGRGKDGEGRGEYTGTFPSTSSAGFTQRRMPRPDESVVNGVPGAKSEMPCLSWCGVMAR